MRYVLIDSCTLRNLIDNHGYSKDLSEIHDLILQNKLCFITHELILKEWEKHKYNWQNSKKRKLLGYEKHNDSNEKEIVPFQSSISTDHLPTQIHQIDKILNSAKEILATPPVIENEFARRYRDRLAPCHKKKDSQNDWEIFGSFCHYCELNGISDVYFLSANYTDFGNEEEEFTTIHIDLKDRFKSLCIKYFKDHKDFLTEAKKDQGISFELIRSTIIPNERYSFKTTMRKNVLDSLLFIYNDLYSEIDFVPIHILKKYYPFSTSEESHCYYSKFTLSYVSERVTTLFSKIKVTEKNKIEIEDKTFFQGINNYEEKIRVVLKKLSLNLVFHVVGEKTRERVCIHYHESGICECSKCTFDRFQFSSSLQSLQNQTEDLKENLKKAYLQCQFGNFRSAAAIYDEIAEKAFNQKLTITYFIAKYNQQHLASFLRNFFANETIDYQLVKRLSSIDKLEEAVKLKSHSDYKLLSFIAQEDFFNDAFQEITENTNKIVSHYHSQLKGGWSSNSFIWDLIGAFASLEAFLTNNFIIYDAYSNFTKLFEIVVEGIFASYAISKDQGDRFEKFDNYWVHKFIIYGNSDSIVKLFNRYGIETIPNEANDINNESLLNLATNLLKYLEESQGSKSEFIEDGNIYFEQKCLDLLENILTVSSILELSDEILSKVAKLILDHLKLELKLSHKVVKALEFFLEKKGKLLNEQIKIEFLSWGLKSQDCHRDTLLTTLEIFENNRLTDISDLQFESILKQCLFICDKCGQRHEMLLGTFFEKADALQKKIICKTVSDEMTNATDFGLLYILWMYEIIPFDKERLMQFIGEYKFSGPRKTRSFLGSGFNFQISKLDKIINLCFKFDIDTRTPFFDEIKKSHIYYEWLLDLENFNYEHFDAQWVLLYSTSHYMKAMSKSERLKAAIRESLFNKFHLGIERYLLRITNFIT